MPALHFSSCSLGELASNLACASCERLALRAPAGSAWLVPQHAMRYSGRRLLTRRPAAQPRTRLPQHRLSPSFLSTHSGVVGSGISVTCDPATTRAVRSLWLLSSWAFCWQRAFIWLAALRGRHWALFMLSSSSCCAVLRCLQRENADAGRRRLRASDIWTILLAQLTSDIPCGLPYCMAAHSPRALRQRRDDARVLPRNA